MWPAHQKTMSGHRSEEDPPVLEVVQRGEVYANTDALCGGDYTESRSWRKPPCDSQRDAITACGFEPHPGDSLLKFPCMRNQIL